MRKPSAWMHNFTLLLSLFLLISLALPCSVFAAKPETPGKPGGWPEGEGPPEGKGPKSGGGETRKGDLFGDPLVVVRDLSPEADGKPLYFRWTWPDELRGADGELNIQPGDLPQGWEIPTNQGDPDACIQPISFEPLLGLAEEDLALVAYEPYFDSYGVYPEFVYLIPLDEECNIPEAYAGTWGEQVAEIEAGRLNLARTTQSVLDAAYAEAIATINTATAIQFDAAGRLVLTIPDTTEGERLKTIDSPRENLALYQKLMQTTCLSGLSEQAKTLFTGPLAHLLVCDASNQPSEADLQRAASFFAGAADKFGHVGIDEVVYVNTILRINSAETLSDGSWLITGYKDMGDFPYSRYGIHGGTRARLLQPIGTSITEFAIAENVDIYTSVFQGPWNYLTGSDELPSYPLMNFVRAVDDALSIIYYIHNFEPPIAPVPKVP